LPQGGIAAAARQRTTFLDARRPRIYIPTIGISEVRSMNLSHKMKLILLACFAATSIVAESRAERFKENGMGET
jgi:hypothetical protein